MSYCSICGTSHDTTACPPVGVVVGNIAFEHRLAPATLNGMTPFEQAILEKLDALIAAVNRPGNA